MASRLFIEATVEDIDELAGELARVAEIAKRCSEYMREHGKTSYSTDGFNSAIEGLDAVVRLLGEVVGVYNAPLPKLVSVRAKVQVVRDQKKEERAAKAVEDADAAEKARRSGNKTPTIQAKSKKKPASPTPATNPKKKA
jgi:hypothetical protein